MKQIHSIIWRENNLYVVKALEVEVVSQGESENEAIMNLKGTLNLYYEN